MKEMIINCETGEKIVQDLTPEQIAHAEEFDRKNELVLAKKAAALAKLEALGLDEEDLRALGL